MLTWHELTLTPEASSMQELADLSYLGLFVTAFLGVAHGVFVSMCC
jgi:hypothetical protein